MLFALLTSLLALTGTFARPSGLMDLVDRASIPENPDHNTTGASNLQILQLALVVENLEVALFKYGTVNITAQDYASAGYPDWVYGRLNQIRENDEAHVAFLQAAIGKDNNIPPCEYEFPFGYQPSAFLLAANALKQVAASAYTGSLNNLDTAYARVTGTISATEARHQAWIYSAIFKGAAWTGPFDTYISLDESYSYSMLYTTSCPSSSPALPFKAFPTLYINGNAAGYLGNSGDNVQLHFNGSNVNTDGLYANLVNGLGQVNIPIVNSNITLPQGIQGWSFIVVTSASSPLNVTDANTLAGPAFVHVDFDSSASNPGFMNTAPTIF